MSRCFPFPPPGYEIKARPDDVSLIIKDKDKQKKHKDKDKKKKDRSERKDKEKSEGKHKEDKEKEKNEGKHHKEDKEKEKSEGKHHKEDKEKEKSEGKHREDKDRKHKKHKDKKEKKTDTLTSPEEKKIVVGSLDNKQKSEKLVVLDSKPSNGVDDYRISVELGKRVRDDGGATDSRAVHKITVTEQRKINSGDGPYDDINNKGDHRHMANGETPKFSGENQIKVKERNKHKNKNENKDDVGKGDGCKNEDEYKNRKAEEKKRKKEKKKEKSKEKSKQGVSEGISLDFHDNNNNNINNNNPLKESRDSQVKLPKHKEPVSNGFLHDNRIRPNCASRPALSSHQDSQNGGGAIHPSQTNTTNSAVEKGAVMNRKVDGVLPSSPQSVIKNVRNMAANNTTTEHRKAKIDNNHVGRNGLNSSHVVVNESKMEKIIKNFRVDEKLENGRKMPPTKELLSSMNGVCESKIDNSSRSSSASVEVKEKKISTTSVKPPHPDSKYLSQILAVPAVVELPQFDDQDWLFGCKDWDSRPKRPRLGPPENVETKPVWAEAVQLESGDVTALPYVIPY